MDGYIEQLEKILTKVLSPGPNSPYISSYEIDENDKLLEEALEIVMTMKNLQQSPLQ